MKIIVPVLCLCWLLIGCRSSSQRVVKPRTHKVWAKGNRYVIDIPVGTRHIHLFERKRTRMVRMN